MAHSIHVSQRKTRDIPISGSGDEATPTDKIAAVRVRLLLGSLPVFFEELAVEIKL